MTCATSVGAAMARDRLGSLAAVRSLALKRAVASQPTAWSSARCLQHWAAGPSRPGMTAATGNNRNLWQGTRNPRASTSRLPTVMLASRIRTRSASTEADKAERTTAVTASASGQHAAAETGKDDVVKPQKLKEKVKMGEVRRLVELAKPERKTIGIAIGLVGLQVKDVPSRS